MKTFWIICGMIGILVGLCWVSSILFADTEEGEDLLSASSNIRIHNVDPIYKTGIYAVDDLSREQQIELMSECVKDMQIVFDTMRWSRGYDEESQARIIQMFFEYRTRGR